MTLHKVFAAIGAFVVVTILFKFLKGVFRCFLRPGKAMTKFGAWAIVTGATDGIGFAMACELAKKGCNILLISRSQDKLDQCANEIRTKFTKIQVKVCAIDFAAFDEISRNKVVGCVKDLDVGICINNVGVSYPFTKFFHELQDHEVDGLIKINIDSTTWMTRIVLPKMIEKKRGAIVNIGSAAGVSNSPLLAQYGAAKSYVAMFSRTLNAELASKGVHVQCQIPMFVATKLVKIKNASLFVPTPAAYARSAVAAIGYDAVVSPYWTHALQIWALTNFPEWLVAPLVMKVHMGIRTAGQKKEKAAAVKSAAEAERNAPSAGGEGDKKSK